MKRVLTVQDLSCMGKCSLTVALPVLSAMGCAVSVLPTAVLSTHTGFPDPYVKDLTGDIDKISLHWKQVGAQFDAVTVGYLSDPEQAAAVERVLDAFGTFAVIDPVLGDHGKPYSRITQAHIAAMKSLCPRAKVLIPNVTEACLLTGMAYREVADTLYFRELAEAVRALGPEAVVITGVSEKPQKLGCVALEGTELFSYQADRIGRSCHGTGDMFAAVLTGGLLRGKPLPQAAALAAGFAEQVIAQTREASPFGAEFEPCLPWLWEQLNK